MLHFLFGRAHSGKTSEILRRISSLSPDAGKGMLLVPDQSTFEAERRCYRTLGGSGYARIQVTGFARLSERIVGRFRPDRHDHADAPRKLLLMQLALEEVGSKLKAYDTPASRSRLAPILLTAVEQCKSACLSPQDLASFAHTLPGGILRAKTEDLAEVYFCYGGLLERRFSDPLDNVAVSAELAKEHRLFADGIFFLDGFDYLSPDKIRLLEQMLLQGKEVWVSLTADESDPRRDALFALGGRLYHQLRALAHKLGVPVAVPVYVKAPPNRPPCLNALEKNLYSPAPEAFAGDTAPLHLISAPNRYEEGEAAAAVIRFLTAEGLRYRDIAVVVGDAEGYQSLLEAAFEKYEIPYYMDDARSPLQSPLVRTVQHILALAGGSLDLDEGLGLLKCGLTPFDETRVGELENYLYLWDLGREEFFHSFTRSVYGLEGVKNDAQRQEQQAALARLNELRTFLLDGVMPLRTLGECGAKDFTLALFDALERLSVRQTMQSLLDALETDTDEPALSLAMAAQTRRTWESLQAACTAIGEICGEKTLSPSKYGQYLELLLEQSELETVPQAIDCVNVGQSGKLHLEQPKALLVLGALEGSFPKTPEGCPLFAEREEQFLSEQDFPLARSLTRRTQEGMFYAYQTLTAPQEKLFLFFPAGDLRGELLPASPLVEQLRRIFPALTAERTELWPDDRFCYSKEAGFSRLACADRDDPELFALRAYFSSQPEYAEHLDWLRRGRESTSWKLSPQQAKLLYGEHPWISPSRVEDFYRCPYAFFCKQGLRLFPRGRAAYDPLTRGNLVHEILCKVLERIGDEDEISPEALQSLAEECVEQYLQVHLPEGGRARLAAQIRRAGQGVVQVLGELIEQIRHSRFRPAAFEYRIGAPGHEPPLTVTTEQGNVLSLHGTVDRIDVYTDESGQGYLRVIDYKTGDKTLRLCDVLSGLNLQMMIYLICLRRGHATKLSALRSAGLLYQPAAETLPSLGRLGTQEEWEQKKRRAHRMNGLVLNEKKVVLAMDDTLSGGTIPVEPLSKAFKVENGEKVPDLESLFDENGQAVEGLFAAAGRDTLVDAGTLGVLMEKTLDQVRQMCDRVFAGEIAPLPVEEKKNVLPCAWCDYAALCRHRPSDPVRRYEQKSNRELMEELRKDCKK